MIRSRNRVHPNKMASFGRQWFLRSMVRWPQRLIFVFSWIDASCGRPKVRTFKDEPWNELQPSNWALIFMPFMVLSSSIVEGWRWKCNGTESRDGRVVNPKVLKGIDDEEEFNRKSKPVQVAVESTLKTEWHQRMTKLPDQSRPSISRIAVSSLGRGSFIVYLPTWIPTKSVPSEYPSTFYSWHVGTDRRICGGIYVYMFMIMSQIIRLQYIISESPQQVILRFNCAPAAKHPQAPAQFGDTVCRCRPGIQNTGSVFNACGRLDRWSAEPQGPQAQETDGKVSLKWRKLNHVQVSWNMDTITLIDSDVSWDNKCKPFREKWLVTPFQLSPRIVILICCILHSEVRALHQ